MVCFIIMYITTKFGVIVDEDHDKLLYYTELLKKPDTFHLLQTRK